MPLRFSRFCKRMWLFPLLSKMTETFMAGALSGCRPPKMRQFNCLSLKIECVPLIAISASAAIPLLNVFG